MSELCSVEGNAILVVWHQPTDSEVSIHSVSSSSRPLAPATAPAVPSASTSSNTLGSHTHLLTSSLHSGPEPNSPFDFQPFGQPCGLHGSVGEALACANERASMPGTFGNNSSPPTTTGLRTNGFGSCSAGWAACRNDTDQEETSRIWPVPLHPRLLPCLLLTSEMAPPTEAFGKAVLESTRSRVVVVRTDDGSGRTHRERRSPLE
ncbi:unnamed protein product [Protopolystoma xenopodis]|uniref:Uncharacterized protein n=1 Tax=Protopolystoma xenopodis TaxID=117903 RepID=A0A448XIU8_9PLAT|nr:unnamed protein product [Protopolystoma xenopodis]